MGCNNKAAKNYFSIDRVEKKKKEISLLVRLIAMQTIRPGFRKKKMLVSFFLITFFGFKQGLSFKG